MENVALVVFEVESEAYQAFSELKNDAVNSAYTILQIAVVKNRDGRIITTDGFDSGTDSTDDTFKGGLIGLLVGILGGPLGVILGGATGALIGNIEDTRDVNKNASLLEYISTQLTPDETGLVILIQENDESALNLRLSKYDDTIVRFDAAKIADEVEQQEAIDKELRREAKERLKAQRKADRTAAIAAKRDQLQGDFDHVKDSIKTTAEDAIS